MSVSVRIQWNRGTIPKVLSLDSTIRSVVIEIGKEIGIEQHFLDLYYDPYFTRVIPKSETVESAKIQDRSFLYLKILTKNVKNVHVPICQMTEPVDIYKQYLGPKEKEMTSEMKRVQHDFGPKAVSSCFFDHLMSLKPQVDFQPESSCYALRIGQECLSRFRMQAYQSNFTTHRLTFLFGRINRITGKVTVHVSCEPPQISTYEKCEISPTFDLTTPVQVAQMFGMECVGIAISHLSDEKYPVTSYMVQLSSRLQNLFGEYFTTVVIMPEGDSDVKLEAFQMSDAAVRIYREQLFCESTDEHIVHFKEKLLVCGQKKNEADVNLLLCAVRVRSTNSRFISHSFPPPAFAPSKFDVQNFFADKEFCPLWYAMFDFNLLVYLANMRVFTKDEMETIVNCIIDKSDMPEMVMEKINEFCNDENKE